MTKIVNVACFGDGVTAQRQFQGGELNSRDGWIYTVNSTGGGKFLCSSFGQTGFTAANSLQRLSKQLPAMSNFVDVILFQVYANIDGSTLVADYASIQAALISARNLVEGAGKGFVANFLLPAGANVTTAPEQTAWTSLRTWAHAVFPRIVDPVDAISVSTGYTWNPLFSEDNQHPNLAGSSLLGNTVMPQLKAILAAWGYSV